MPKRKSDSEEPVRSKKPNGIKGITTAEKSNDSLRDELLETLQTSGIEGTVESRIIFAHTGIYVAGTLLGWVGKGGFSLRCTSAKQRELCKSFDCENIVSENHKDDKYWKVPDAVLENGPKFRSLAEKFIALAPAKKPKSTKSTKSVASSESKPKGKKK